MSALTDEALAKLLDAATPGPWAVAGTRHTGDLKVGKNARLHFVGPDGDSLAAVFFDMKTGVGFADAKLIAAAPDLAAEVLALRKRVEAADALAEAVDQDRNGVCQDIGRQLDAANAVDRTLAAYRATGAA